MAVTPGAKLGPFYTAITDDFLVCPVTPKGSEIEVGTPQHLFHTPLVAVGVLFDVSSDGKRLLVNHTEEAAQAPLELVTNWPAELKEIAFQIPGSQITMGGQRATRKKF